jgi:Protein of unknown function (DUF3987)
MLVVDYDHVDDMEQELDIWRGRGYGFAAYTTHSHLRVTDTNPEAKECFRLCLPLAKPIPGGLYPALWRWAFKASGERIDPAPKDASRMFYAPVKASGGSPYCFEVFDGLWLDWEQLNLEEESKEPEEPINESTQEPDDLVISDGSNNYTRAAFDKEINILRSAKKKGRNDQLNRSAFALGQFVGGGLLNEQEVVTVLENAARYIGLDRDSNCGQSGIRATIKSGLESGKRQPRTAPEDKTSKGRQAKQQTATQTKPGWSEPQPIPPRLRPVPKLPEAVIPEALRGWLADIAERLQVPIDYPAVAAIIGLCSVVGSQLRIRPKQKDDWTVTPNIWGGIIGPPGTMKSPAIDEGLKPLRKLEKEAEKDLEKKLQEFCEKRVKHEATKAARKDQMKAAAKKGESLDPFVFTDEEPEEPTEKRYIANDVTVEKYGELLNENPRGLLILRDELTGWLRSLDDERRASDRAFYLEAWNGDGRFTYDRIGRGTLKIKNNTTSICGGIQPDPLQMYLRTAVKLGGRWFVATVPDNDLPRRANRLGVDRPIAAQWRA